MTDISIDSDKQFCKYCRKPLLNTFSDSFSSEFHSECQELIKTFNTDEYSPFSLYDDFHLVNEFFLDLISDVPNKSGLDFSSFLRDSCFWDNNGKLIKLKIFGGFLTKIPDSISNFQCLTSLIIHNNRYIPLPNNLIELEHLQQLELHFNSYYQQNYPIPRIIFQNKLIKELSLTGYFSSINVPFDELPMLKELRLIIYRDTKSYIDFPNSVTSCGNLQLLQLNAKYLNMNGETFSDMSYLQEFDLANNNLGKLPERFGDLASLEKLSLASNRFKQIPQCLVKLPRLRELDLSMNMIQKISDYTQQFSNLNQLILTDNPLKEKNVSNFPFKIYN